LPSAHDRWGWSQQVLPRLRLTARIAIVGDIRRSTGERSRPANRITRGFGFGRAFQTLLPGTHRSGPGQDEAGDRSDPQSDDGDSDRGLERIEHQLPVPLVT